MDTDILLEKLAEINKLSDVGVSLPLSIFTDRRLGMLEAAVVYLHEEQGLKFSKISDLLNRDNRTIWATYHKAKQKMGGTT